MFVGMVANKWYNAQLLLGVGKSCRHIELELEIIKVPPTLLIMWTALNSGNPSYKEIWNAI